MIYIRSHCKTLDVCGFESQSLTILQRPITVGDPRLFPADVEEVAQKWERFRARRKPRTPTAVGPNEVYDYGGESGNEDGGDDMIGGQHPLLRG